MLSTAARAKARKAQGSSGLKDAGKLDESKMDEEKKEEESSDVTKEPEPSFEILKNPARVVPEQEKFISWEAEQRYRPINPSVRSGIVLLM